MSRLGRLTLIALAASLLAACSLFVPKLKPPKLEVTSVTLRGGNLQQQRLAVGLHAINPNNRTVQVDRIDCHLEVLGTEFAQGTTDAAFILPANGTTDFTLNVVSQLSGAMVALNAAMNHATVDYRLYGQVHFGGGTGVVRTLNFDQHGQVRL